MPFDPTKPAFGSPDSSPEMRAQLNALNDKIDATLPRASRPVRCGGTLAERGRLAIIAGMSMNPPLIVALLLVSGGFLLAQDDATPAAAEAPAAAPAQTEMQKWIAKTDEGWQASYQREVTDVHEAEVNKLKLQYLNLLNEAIAKASKASDLDGAVALRTEQKRFSDTQFFPDQDEAGDAALVKQARATLRALLAQTEKGRAVRAKALFAKYDLVLAGAQTQLTKAQRLEDALLVKAKREEVAAAWGMMATIAVQEKPSPATQPGDVGKPRVTGAPAIPSPAAATADAKTFEMRMIGTTWSFPWNIANDAIRFEENGKLVLIWAKSESRQWRTPRDGVVEVFPSSNPTVMETIKIDSSARKGVLTRKGKIYNIVRIK